MDLESSQQQAMATAMLILASSGSMSLENLNSRLDEINQDYDLTENDKLSLEKLRSEGSELFDALGMELLDARDDYTNGQRYLMVVNRETFPDSVNRLNISQSMKQQLKHLILIIFENSRCEGVKPGSISHTEIPNKDELLEVLIDQGWLLQFGDRLFPSTRLVYELEPFFRHEGIIGHTLYPCIGCNQWFLKGKLCENRQCSARLHNRCYHAYYESQNHLTSGICPQCGSGL